MTQAALVECGWWNIDGTVDAGDAFGSHDGKVIFTYAEPFMEDHHLLVPVHE